MKKITLYCTILVLLFTTSCSNVLDVNSTDQFGNQTVWGSETAVDMYVTGFYAALRDASEIGTNAGGQPSLSDGYSDIVKYSDYTKVYNKLLLEPDFMNVNDPVFNSWGAYNRIKFQNEFLYNAPSKGYPASFMDIRIAEVHYIRAFLYFQMIRVFGGVVLRDEVGGPDGPSQNNKARATVDESWDFVIKDLQFAAKYLPVKWDDQWTGRLTKGNAYAMLTRVGVYAHRWDVTIDATKELMNLNQYGLMENYADIFTKPNNKEVIAGVYFTKPTFVNHFDTYCGPSGDDPTKRTVATPTNELVDSYEMADGSKFNWNNPSQASNPYANREPRFYASILYNGAQWKGRSIETFVGGKDGFVDYAVAPDPHTTTTGYYIRKFLQQSNTNYISEGGDQYWVELRYAEVLLNYAEALAQKDYATNSGEALAALNKIRNRVNLPSKTLTDAPDLNAFMTLLEHERMVEFAFEGKRYWDIRRWHIAADVLNGKMAHGTKVIKNSDGTFNYNIVNCDANTPRFFPEKYYLSPIPPTEMTNNKLCKQTPGW